ncbi:Stromal interaction molecule Orai1-activating region [Trinorchestia longiramus]|nr:Stromal interaction molecule Orai1-activating region [Trinorchestia longiramus]
MPHGALSLLCIIDAVRCVRSFCMASVKHRGLGYSAAASRAKPPPCSSGEQLVLVIHESYIRISTQRSISSTCDARGLPDQSSSRSYNAPNKFLLQVAPQRTGTVAGSVFISRSACVMVDGLCLPVEDMSSYEAIKSLHRLLDDDKSGEIDMNESVDFLKEELTITDGYNSRQKNLHNNSDRFISVQDLWHLWKRSEVHNWTVEETVQWMSDTVGLPQYAETIVSHAINGSYLPRLTMNKSNYLGAELGIKGLSHRTKVTVKAMDAVLFGPPKVSRTKDLLIACLITVILIGFGYVIIRNHKMRGYHNRLIMQIEDLQLEESKYRMHLRKIKEKSSDASSPDTAAEGPDSGVMGDISDISSTHEDSDGSEGRVGSSEDAPDSVDQGGCYDDDYSQTGGSGTPPHMSDGHLLDRASLIHWLQVTYQKEKNVVDAKRRKAHQEFNKANDICQKLRAQGKNPLNLFSLMHGKMDNVEKTISNARATMQGVQRDEAERQERWGEIERLLECNIRQRAELHSIMGSFTSLQTATSPTESSNIGTCGAAVAHSAVSPAPSTEVPRSSSSSALTDASVSSKTTSFTSSDASVLPRAILRASSVRASLGSSANVLSRSNTVDRSRQNKALSNKWSLGSNESCDLADDEGRSKPEVKFSFCETVKKSNSDNSKPSKELQGVSKAIIKPVGKMSVSKIRERLSTKHRYQSIPDEVSEEQSGVE